MISSYYPIDKSWTIRMGFLDLAKGYKDIHEFLENEEILSDDLKALKRVCEKWDTSEPLDVGESGTLYRILRFYFWKKGENREFILRGTLKNRNICDNPEIVKWPLERLKDEKLDKNTSQWQSAAILSAFVFNEDIKKIENPDPKVQLTYDGKDHWKQRRDANTGWSPRYDSTIASQINAYVKFLETGEMNFKPKHSEDYCFARAFNLITQEEGKEIFPSLEGHETNRIIEMEKALIDADDEGILNSKDHRVVQAIVMKYAAKKTELKVMHKNAVNKSWPEFPDFMEYCNKIPKYKKAKFGTY